MAQPIGPKQDGDPWRSAYGRLVGWCMKKRRLSLADAEEVVQEAIAQFVAAGGPVDGDLKSLLDGVGSRINGVIVNLRRKKALTHVLWNGPEKVDRALCSQTA